MSSDGSSGEIGGSGIGDDDDTGGGEPGGGEIGCDVVAVVLAAGRGSRMGRITETLPKPLVPVLGRPALEWVVEALGECGIRRFVIVTGYLSEQVVAAVEGLRGAGGASLTAETISGSTGNSALSDDSDSRRFGKADLEFVCIHQDEQLGTAHAMRLTREVVGGAPVVLAFADIMTSATNYGAMIDRFKRNDCAVVGGVRDVGDPYKAAAVYMDEEGNIERIIEKPAQGSSTTPWAHAGMYCFANVVYDYIERITPSARGEYEITDAVAMMIADGLKCQAQELVGYWKDLATMEDVREAEDLIKRSVASGEI